MPVLLVINGSSSEPFMTNNTGNDYFGFRCRTCGESPQIFGFMLDSAKRVIFNLKCRKCKHEDALKIALDTIETGKTLILISKLHEKFLSDEPIVNC